MNSGSCRSSIVIVLFHLCPAPPPPPQPTPGVLRSICPPCQSWGGAFANFALPGGGGHLPTPGPFPSFWHAVSCQNITTQKVLLGKKADWLICQGQEKIVEGCKGMFRILHVCMHFFIAYQARITEQNWSYRCESTFFGYWIKFLLILFEEHPFIFIKLFITYKSHNFTTVY